MNESIIVADPNNMEHVELFEDLKKNRISLSLKELENTDSNEIRKVLFEMAPTRVTKIAYIDGYTDNGQCNIYFYRYRFGSTYFLDQVVDYSFNNLGMKSVFFHVPNNRKIINHLLAKNYELIGKVDTSNDIIFMKDVEDKVKTRSRRR